MSKAWIHALSSAKRFGGTPEDDIAIHERMDSTKSAHAEVTHRCVFHLGFIPSPSDGLKEMPPQPWMAGRRKPNVTIVG